MKHCGGSLTALIRNKTTGKTRLIEANEVVLVPEVTHPRSVLTRFCHIPS